MNRPAPYGEDRVGASHNVDPSTSREAAALNFPKSGSQRALILKALARTGERGATFEELQAVTGVRSAAKRLTELKQDGWAKARTTVDESGREVDVRRGVESGATAVVYVATAKAVLQLEAERSPHQSAGGMGASSPASLPALNEPPGRDVEWPSADHDQAVSLFGDEQLAPRRSTSHYTDVEAA